MSSLYYQPTENGVHFVGDVDLGDYDFNMFAVFQRMDDKALFYGEDSGCSCNIPFEDFKFDELTRITDIAEFHKVARKWIRDRSGTAHERDAMERLIVKTRQLYRKAAK